jgi:hypothetical protein
MEQLQLLGIALGLATLSGLNLYLTVFATGLAIQQHWITLAPQYESLSILSHPAVLIVAGVMYLLQFFADKVPWVDSLWDAVHTVIRPVGGAFLAIRVLGTPDPVYDVVIALLAGGVTMIAHGTKAGVRLVANHSPEPFSNIALSVGEDVAVLGGLALMARDPILALIVFSIVLASICYFGPRIFRALKVNLWLLWRKLVSPSADQAETELVGQLPAEHHIIFHAKNLLGEKIAWAVPCVSGAAKRIPGNVFGYLVATIEDHGKIWFVGKRGWSKFAEELDLTTYKVVHEPKFLSENVVLYSLERKPKYLFLFDRTQSAIVKQVVANIQERLGQAAALTAREAPADA